MNINYGLLPPMEAPKVGRRRQEDSAEGTRPGQEAADERAGAEGPGRLGAPGRLVQLHARRRRRGASAGRSATCRNGPCTRRRSRESPWPRAGRPPGRRPPSDRPPFAAVAAELRTAALGAVLRDRDAVEHHAVVLAAELALADQSSSTGRKRFWVSRSECWTIWKAARALFYHSGCAGTSLRWDHLQQGGQIFVIHRLYPRRGVGQGHAAIRFGDAGEIERGDHAARGLIQFAQAQQPFGVILGRRRGGLLRLTPSIEAAIAETSSRPRAWSASPTPRRSRPA